METTLRRTITFWPEASAGESFLDGAGRALYSLPFMVFGVMHFFRMNAMSGMVPDYLPLPSAWVLFTGAAMLLAALAIITDRFTRAAGIGLCLMLVGFATMVHLPGVIDGNQPSISNMLKDLALGGGALTIAGRLRSAPDVTVAKSAEARSNEATGDEPTVP